MEANYQKEFEDTLAKDRHLAVMVRDRAKQFGDQIIQRDKSYGEWVEIPWTEFYDNMHAVSKGLIELGVAEEETVSVFSPSRAEWHQADIAILSIRAISVPIYPTNSTKEAEYLIDDAKVKVVFAGAQAQYDRTMELLDASKTLKYVIVFDKNVKIDTSRDNVMYYSDFIEMGKKTAHDSEVEKRLKKAHYDDIATLIYTSGTTGEPKGAIIIHKNLIHQYWAVGNYPFKGMEDLCHNVLSFLPLSHVFERSWCFGMFNYGITISYCGDHTQVVDYMQDVKPELMISAPRLYEKMYSTIHSRVESAPALRKKLFYWATGLGKKVADRKYQKKFISPFMKMRHALADKLVLSKLRALFGGNTFFFASGGAAISGEICDFFNSVGVNICSGYGLTETSPVISCNSPFDFLFGSNGKLIPLVELKVDDTSGELLTRGPNVMKGYFNKPDASKEAFTDDGWFRTGDVGHLDKNGYLFITDRIKDLIVTAGGKNIAPQLIETLIGEDYFVENVAVIGEGKKFISALIVPAFEALEEWANTNNIAFSSRDDLVANPEIFSLFEKLLADRSIDLNQVEKIKKFTLLTKEFSQETGEITPTMKVKRKFVQEKYASQIEAMYT
ncbi:MAG: long-chain fatty acid--CoA ligase [bacterium]|nr:long-chain fatty acid--CoA ligase [bacterium]